MVQANPSYNKGGDGRETRTEVRPENRPVHTLEVEHFEDKISRLYHQVENLVETQLDLAKTEISEKISQVKKGAGSLTTGSALAFYGGQAIIAGLVLLLNLWIGALWISALAVGAVVALIGYIMMASGKKAMSPDNLKPERTMRSLREDSQAVKRRIQ